MTVTTWGSCLHAVRRHLTHDDKRTPDGHEVHTEQITQTRHSVGAVWVAHHVFAARETSSSRHQSR